MTPSRDPAAHPPALINRPNNRKSTGQHRDTHPLWIRLAAFLSLKSLGTQKTYRGIIEEWCTFLGATLGSQEGAERLIAANDLAAIAYRNWLEKQQGQTPRFMASPSKSKSLQRRSSPRSRADGLQGTLTAATIRKKFAALRRVYRMLIAAELGISSNPFDTDKVPPPALSGQKRPTEMVDFSLVKKIVALPDRSSPKGLRDSAILAALFGGGLRRSEAVSLRIGDIRRTPKGTMFMHLRATKGKRDADQALPKWAGAILAKLLEQRRTVERAGLGDYLFISYRGRGGSIATPHPLSDSGLYKLFKRYCELAGAGHFLSPHSARATAITKLLSDGIGHREVQEFSRHASVQMVEAYDKRRIGVDENPANDLEYD